MPRKTESSKSVVDLVKNMNADGSQKQRGFRYLRTDLSKLETANDFARAFGDLAALGTLLMALGHKDYIKVQFDFLKELRHLAELKEAKKMLTPNERADEVVDLLRKHLPPRIVVEVEAALRQMFYEENVL